MLLLALFILLPLLALGLFDLLAWRWGVDSRDWSASGEWDWRRRAASDGIAHDD
jgi:hypothetical protein